MDDDGVIRLRRVISKLARQFAVSDRWHASAPNQTWPNRFFVHTGTAAGHVNNSPPRFPYDIPSIFNRLMPLFFQVSSIVGE